MELNSAAAEILKNIFTERHSRNPRYSMRAFAKSIGVSHTVLSLVLSGKRGLSKNAAGIIAERLALNPTEAKRLRNATSMSAAQSKKSLSREYQKIEMELFHLISDWVHYAILSLVEIEMKLLTPKKISKVLNVSEAHAKLALERLLGLDLIRKAEGRYQPTGKPIKFDNEKSSAGARKFQRQLMEKAMDSLEADSFEIRDLSSTTMAIDPKLVPYARQRIREFRRELTEELEGKGNRSEVYNLTVQIYPVSKRNQS